MANPIIMKAELTLGEMALVLTALAGLANDIEAKKPEDFHLTVDQHNTVYNTVRALIYKVETLIEMHARSRFAAFMPSDGSIN